MKKYIFVITVFLLLFSFSCKADNADYTQQYEALNLEEIKNSLDSETQNLFEKMGIDPSDEKWVNKISGEGVFKHIKNFLSVGLKRPLKSGCAVFAVIIITAAITSFGNTDAANQTAIFASAAACGAIVATNVFSTVSASANSMKSICIFMLAFIPIFAGLVSLSGNAVTSVSMSTLLLTATESVSMISSFFIMPFMGGYLSISLSSTISPLIARSSIAELIKKISLWTFSLLSTVFVGILGIQTAVNSAADTLTAKTAKFIIGTSVPITGTALAEAAATVSASMGLLKSSIGIYGVVAIIFILLPTVAELILWRIIICLCSALSDSFSLLKIGDLLRAVDSMLSILLGLLLLVAGLFIISFSVVISVGKAL